jgi:hypothetical protein
MQWDCYRSCVIKSVRIIEDRLRRLVWSDCKLCKSSIVLQLFVVTTTKYPINPITRPNSRLNHCDTWRYEADHWCPAIPRLEVHGTKGCNRMTRSNTPKSWCSESELRERGPLSTQRLLGLSSILPNYRNELHHGLLPRPLKSNIHQTPYHLHFLFIWYLL